MTGATWLLSVVICMYLPSGSRAQECTVTSLAVQSSFDFGKFTGKWFEIKRYSDAGQSPRLIDSTHNYVQIGDGRATVYTEGRDTVSKGQCEGKVHTLTSVSPGKLVLNEEGSSFPYWILDTDYTQYAFVYGCYNISNDGTCNGTRAWILSRTSSLPQNVLGKTSAFYQNICVDEGRFQTINQTQECGVKTHWKLRDDQDCTVNNINVQENFDINKYAGTWYETRWLAPFYIPPNQLFQDYQHHYVITADGNMTGYVYGRSPDNPDQCFYNHVVIDSTSSPGKMLYKYKDDPDVPYWVLRTDYTQYAVVYGCYNVSSDGSCYEARSWVWSRTPTLPKHLEYEVNTLLQSICVNPSAFLRTEQNKRCAHPLIWSYNDQQDCNVTKHSLSSNLTANILSRVFYNVMWLPDSSRPVDAGITDYQVEIFTNSKQTTYLYTRQRQNGKCTYSKNIYKKEVLMYQGPSQAAIDYDAFGVMFRCDQVGSDGGCMSARGSVWSADPTLSQQHQYTVNTILQELCLNPVAFVTRPNKNACPPQDIPDCPTVTGSAGKGKELNIIILGAQLYIFIILLP